MLSVLKSRKHKSAKESLAFASRINFKKTVPEENNLVYVNAENIFIHEPAKHDFQLYLKTVFLI